MEVIYNNTAGGLGEFFSVGNYGGTGTLIVDGPGTTLTSTGRRIELGEFGTATMEVRNGASVYTTGYYGGLAIGGYGGTGSATLIVDGPGTNITIIESSHEIIHDLACISNGGLITAGRSSSQ